MNETLMPDAFPLGSSLNSPIGTALFRRRDWIERGRPADPLGRRMIMGFVLPVWQRPLVWTEEQKVSLIENIWRGIPIGTYTYNVAGYNSPNDMLLIDGQQRMSAIEDYILDKFPVFGYKYSEITRLDRRCFDMRMFASYETRSEDEAYLRNYYNIMNFAGVAHTEDQKA